MLRKIKIHPFLVGVGCALMVLAVILTLNDGKLDLKSSKAATSYTQYWSVSGWYYDSFGYYMGPSSWSTSGYTPAGRYYGENWYVTGVITKGGGFGSDSSGGQSASNCTNTYCSNTGYWANYYNYFTIPYSYTITGTVY